VLRTLVNELDLVLAVGQQIKPDRRPSRLDQTLEPVLLEVRFNRLQLRYFFRALLDPFDLLSGKLALECNVRLEYQQLSVDNPQLPGNKSVDVLGKEIGIDFFCRKQRRSRDLCFQLCSASDRRKYNHLEQLLHQEDLQVHSIAKEHSLAVKEDSAIRNGDAFRNSS
jgi:hypothetical protein